MSIPLMSSVWRSAFFSTCRDMIVNVCLLQKICLVPERGLLGGEEFVSFEFSVSIDLAGCLFSFFKSPEWLEMGFPNQNFKLSMK